MPTKYSPRIQRPPSPYRVSQSPRTKSQQRIWRSLGGTGESDSSSGFAEKSREMWLKSLRRGGDSKNAASYKIDVPNPALSSTSDHLRVQMGLPNSARRHRRSNSVDTGQGQSFSPTAMQHKSKEDLCDEIISLKRMLVNQKDDYEVLKTKSRRLEEENQKNSKYIDELLDKKTSDEKVRMLAEGGNHSSSSVNTGLKHKILKLEKRLGDKEKELAETKRDIKVTDVAEMKAAMEMYYQEVIRLQELLKSEKIETSRLASSMSSVTAGSSSRQEALRKKIVQLVAENNQLKEDNQRLQRDMNRALDLSNSGFSDDEDGEEIKFSALSKAELVTLIQKTKSSEARKTEDLRREHADQIAKLKSILSNRKEESIILKEENKKLQVDCKRLHDDLDIQTDKVTRLRTEIESLEKKLERANHHDAQSDSSSKGKRYKGKGKKHESSDDSSDDTITSDHRKRPISRASTRSNRSQKSRPNSAEEKEARNKAALSIQKHWHTHKNRQRKKSEDIVAMQAALRAHNTRTDILEMSSDTTDVSEEISDDSDFSESFDEVVYLQSAMRGHMERSYQ